MSVFHRVDDPMQLSSSRYFLWAERLHFYDGALRGALLDPDLGTSTAALVPAAPTPRPPLDGPPAMTAAPGEEVRYIDDVQQLIALTNQAGFEGFEYAGG